MMIVFRIGRTKYAHDRLGEGARLFGGRWNHKLTPCIYTSASRALAVLEYTANINMDDIPRALSITTFELTATIQELKVAQLPGNWRDSPAPASTKDFGTYLLHRGMDPVYKIPSAILPEEFNFLLNPSLLGSNSLKILDVRDFVYDVRLKL